MITGYNVSKSIQTQKLKFNKYKLIEMLYLSFNKTYY